MAFPFALLTKVQPSRDPLPLLLLIFIYPHHHSPSTQPIPSQVIPALSKQFAVLRDLVLFAQLASHPNVSIALPRPPPRPVSPYIPLYPPYVPSSPCQSPIPSSSLFSRSSHSLHFTSLRQRQFSSFFVKVFIRAYPFPFSSSIHSKMTNFLLLNFNFVIAFFATLTQCQEFPPVQPVPAPPETQNQNLEENPETTTGMPPSVTETTVAPFDGPSQMKGLGGGEQIMTTTPQGNSSEPKPSSPTNGNEEKDTKTVAAGVALSTTVATIDSPGNSFGTTETPLGTDEGPVVGEVELWSFADNLRTTTPSTTTLDSTILDTTTPGTSVDTTTDHSPPLPAAAVAQSTIAMLLMASTAFLTVYAFFR